MFDVVSSVPFKASGSVRKSHELRLLFWETGLANGAETSRTGARCRAVVGATLVLKYRHDFGTLPDAMLGAAWGREEEVQHL